MKNLTKIAMLLGLIIILAACGSSTENGESEESNTTSNKEPIMPEVEVQFEEEPLPLKEETVIQAVVTKGENKVTDAESVKFEIWHTNAGQEQSDTVKAEHTSDGIYEAAYTFEKPGTYQVIAHTQTATMHVMPQVEVKVEGKEDAKKEGGHDHGGESKSSHSHGHGGSAFMVHFMNDQEFKATEKSTLTTHINHEEKPFEKAMVKFEISSDKLEQHKYIPAEEVSPGEYTAAYTFPSEGEYTVTIHYEKPDQGIHGHQEETVAVTK
ncbi:FixH family protein [Halobacillus naozhouensis]|uniref:FixH family protein n=1 Tax=Halobacillus naozhouensis TaxID=554880 RepID=A0ABY8J188_9BACI|nr:FixH family protein [Halobacillus naozhouensis]WFT75841.1 FixH family protein [Halobacillus naozhouensis]